MMARLYFALFVLLLAIVLPQSSVAGTIRVDFAGVVNEVEDPFGTAAVNGVGLDSRFHGYFEVDPSTAIELSTIPLLGVPPGLFVFPNELRLFQQQTTLSGTVTVGTESRRLGPLEPLPGAIVIQSSTVGEKPAFDSYSILSDPFDFFAPSSGVNAVRETCGISLVDYGQTANTGSFYVPGDLSSFDRAEFFCVGAAPAGSEFSERMIGSITSWIVTPEPGGPMLFACAGIVLARRRQLS